MLGCMPAVGLLTLLFCSGGRLVYWSANAWVYACGWSVKFIFLQMLWLVVVFCCCFCFFLFVWCFFLFVFFLFFWLLGFLFFFCIFGLLVCEWCCVRLVYWSASAVVDGWSIGL